MIKTEASAITRKKQLLGLKVVGIQQVSSLMETGSAFPEMLKYGRSNGQTVRKKTILTGAQQGLRRT